MTDPGSGHVVVQLQGPVEQRSIDRRGREHAGIPHGVSLAHLPRAEGAAAELLPQLAIPAPRTAAEIVFMLVHEEISALQPFDERAKVLTREHVAIEKRNRARLRPRRPHQRQLLTHREWVRAAPRVEQRPIEIGNLDASAKPHEILGPIGRHDDLVRLGRVGHQREQQHQRLPIHTGGIAVGEGNVTEHGLDLVIS